MSGLSRRLDIRYYANSAPKISEKQYAEIVKKFEESNKLPARLEIMGIAIDDSMNANMWKVPFEDLDELTKKLEGVQIRKNHGDRVEDVIGLVKNAWREDNKVFYEGEIADEEIIKKILLGYIRYNSIQIFSDDVFCASCLAKGKSEKEAKIEDISSPCPRCGGRELIIRHPQPVEVSMVSLPAYENALVMPVGFRAAVDKVLEEKFKYTSTTQNIHVKDDTTTSGERVCSGNVSLQNETIMSEKSFKAQDTATPSAEIKEPKLVSYDDVMKAFTEKTKEISDIFEKATKALSEEVKKLEELSKKKEEEEEPEEGEEEEEEEEEEESKKKKMEARKKLKALIARKRVEELKKKIAERKMKKEEDEAKKKKIEEIKKKLEEAKKKLEEAKAKKELEAKSKATGKGVVGEVKEETPQLAGDLPDWWKEIYKASKKYREQGLFQG
jgi:hypothetical protein